MSEPKKCRRLFTGPGDNVFMVGRFSGYDGGVEKSIGKIWQHFIEQCDLSASNI